MYNSDINKGGIMKEYRLEGKAVNSDTWLSVGHHFDNINEVRERVAQEKKYDKWYKNSSEDWEYRILVREVSEWEEAE